MRLIEIDSDELKSLLVEAAELGARKALEDADRVNPVITSAEIKRRFGITVFMRAKKDSAIVWKSNGKGGQTSGLYTDRKKFNDWLFAHRERFDKPIVKRSKTKANGKVNVNPIG